jgi:hypothetical protein
MWQVQCTCMPQHTVIYIHRDVTVASSFFVFVVFGFRLRRWHFRCGTSVGTFNAHELPHLSQLYNDWPPVQTGFLLFNPSIMVRARACSMCVVRHDGCASVRVCECACEWVCEDEGGCVSVHASWCVSVRPPFSITNSSHILIYMYISFCPLSLSPPPTPPAIPPRRTPTTHPSTLRLFRKFERKAKQYDAIVAIIKVSTGRAIIEAPTVVLPRRNT